MTIEAFVPAGKMSREQYRRERAELRQLYGDSKREAGARSDQALAAFFCRSGWEQKELAAEERKSESWTARHLLFGHFLRELPTGNSQEKADILCKTLTERRFRGYWERTDPKEMSTRVRFRAVRRLMEEEITLSKSNRHKKPIADAIKATCGNGDWHRLTTIILKVQAVEAAATPDDVRAVLTGMVEHGWHNVFAEKKKGGETYRILKGGAVKIDLDTLQHELGPLVAGLKAEGRKNMATMSPGTVMHLACKIEKALALLAHQAPDHGAEIEEE